MSIRSALSSRAIRAAAAAGVAAVTVGTAGTAFASTTHLAGQHRKGWVPTEECVNWSGTVKVFPALGTTTKKVNAVLNATLNNCNFDGTGQTFSGSAFGVLTGTANSTTESLSGNVAVTWPADANLNPTIASISITPGATAGTYSFNGTIGVGAGTGEQLWGGYGKVSSTRTPGGTAQNIIGSSPFGIFENIG
ncbi:MAG TPA: hypothetical protein VGS19_31585 [Streptosporangiaceae bacterium]|nr:hypothetical protein [Streptosporangiaceae bacterium]